MTPLTCGSMFLGFSDALLGLVCPGRGPSQDLTHHTAGALSYTTKCSSISRLIYSSGNTVSIKITITMCIAPPPGQMFSPQNIIIMPLNFFLNNFVSF